MLASEMSGLPGIVGGSAGFSTKLVILRESSTAITPKAVASARGTSMQPTVQPAPCSDMVFEHQRVVHLVDVVASQHDDVLRLGGLDDVQVLEHRVGGAAIPMLFVDALLRRHQVDGLVQLRAQEAPAALDVAQQRVALVLRHHADAADARVDAVRQREIDDAELAAEVHRRLGALGRSTASGANLCRRPAPGPRCGAPVDAVADPRWNWRVPWWWSPGPDVSPAIILRQAIGLGMRAHPRGDGPGPGRSSASRWRAGTTLSRPQTPSPRPSGSRRPAPMPD